MTSQARSVLNFKLTHYPSYSLLAFEAMNLVQFIIDWWLFSRVKLVFNLSVDRVPCFRAKMLSLG